MATWRDLVGYVEGTGVPHRVTPGGTVRPAGTRTAAGNISCHAEDNDRCDGLDLAGPRPGRDTPELAAIFWAFEPVFDQLHELIYAGPQVSFNIKDGRRVAKYAQSGHHDHVHVAVLATTTLREPNMALTDQDLVRIVKAITGQDGIEGVGNTADQINLVLARLDKMERKLATLATAGTVKVIGGELELGS